MRPLYSDCRERLAGACLVAAMALAAVSGRPAALAEDPGASVAQAKSLSLAFRSVAKQVVPTVVKIKTTIKPKAVQPGQRSPRNRANPFKGTPFEDFFGEDDAPGFPFRTPLRQGVGSGVIVDASGIVMTNNHVVEGADEILVELTDGRQFKVQAADVKTDEQSDLAVVRIKAKESLPVAKLGNSDALEIGDWVLAIGNQFELGGTPTVSAGIISAKERILPSSKRASFLQTDAAINPGNSGGPLVNLDGEVIGINTAIASSSGGYQGVGFALPINQAKWVTDQLIRQGAVQRAYLGVSIEEIDNELAQKFNVAPNKGVLVAEVLPNTPAAAAGIREGDVILTFAGHPVHNPRELQEVVERSPMGSKQKVEIIRDGRPSTVEVVVKTLPVDFRVGSTPSKRQKGADVATFDARELGIEVSDLTDDMAERLGFKGVSGVVITDVDAASVAAEAGLREGMVILRVGKQAVDSVAAFKKAVANESLKNGIMVLVRTPNGNKFVVLQKQ